MNNKFPHYKISAIRANEIADSNPPIQKNVGFSADIRNNSTQPWYSNTFTTFFTPVVELAISTALCASSRFTSPSR